MTKNFINNADFLFNYNKTITLKNKTNIIENQESKNNVITQINEEQLKIIFNLMFNESEFLKNNSEKLLVFYITDNQKKLTEILEKFINF